MVGLLNRIWNWTFGIQEIPDLPQNIFFERDVTADNDFLISCILDPNLEINYINGIVTKVLDTNKCLINEKYHYEPKNEKETRNFPYIEVGSAVRVSLYRKKNSDAQWKVASCLLSNSGPHHQAINVGNESLQGYINKSKPTFQITENIKPVDEDIMTIEILGDMPKMINFEEESIIQILFRNNSYVEEQQLIDYKTMQGNKAQLSIFNKVKLPLVIDIQSQFVFDIVIKGKYLGRSMEKVEFIFTKTTYKVGINIDVIDTRIISSQNSGFYTKSEINVDRLFELQNDVIRGVFRNRVQFPFVKLGLWNIPSQLKKCFEGDNGKFIKMNENVREKIKQLYPDTFEMLTYQNYKAKFHSLLFIEEIEQTISLQKYARERIHFEHCGEFLHLKISGLSEQRPSLIIGDRIIVTDPPNCTKRLGESGKYEGIIHKVMADEIWLKFDPEFHNVCGHYDYSINFFSARLSFRKQHEIINELWKKNRLGESFLFPYVDVMEYKTPKLKIISQNEIKSNIYKDNLNKDNNKLIIQPKIIPKIRWFNEKLNPQQKNAVINILQGEARSLPYIIYGPPGTGKTVTLTESIIQVYKEFPRSKLLICAPTNSAVDTLLGKLINTGLFDKTIMRRIVGYTHFISQSYNMEYDEYCSLPDLENGYQAQHVIKDTKLIMKKDIFKLRIIVTTEGTAGMLYMMGIKSGFFTHIFIDEAGQSMEPELLLPLSFVDLQNDGQVILAGDPKQLGPVVMSLLAKDNGLGQSLLTRFINFPSYQKNLGMFPDTNGYNPKVITHLIFNYRSLPEIVHNYSKLFYDSLLVATKLDDNVRERILLNDLNENVHWDIECKGPVIVHGIMGEDNQEPSSPSWFNPHEAFQVLLYITRLMKSGISADDIGVITPYASQVAKIYELLKMYYPDIQLPKVGTVEMFQGQEKMVIIISLVRSKSKLGKTMDKKFSLGFLIANERINVALSRAKSLLIIVGDPNTMLSNSKWMYILKNSIALNNYVGCNIDEIINVK